MPTKQKSGLYRTAVTVAGQKVWLSARTKKELQDKKRQVKETLVTGRSMKPITFHELVRMWWDDIKSPSEMRPNTRAQYKCYINRWILPGINKRQLAQAVRRADLQKLLSKANEGIPTGATHVKRILEQVCVYGMELGCMSANYAHNLSVKSYEFHRKAAITDDQVRRLFDVASGVDLIMLSLLYYTGIRRGQIMALTWGDIDFSAGTISINKAMQPRTSTIGPCKTDNANRTIEMPADLIEILKPFRNLPSASVLGICNTNYYARHWRNLIEAAGLEGITPHQLRHSYATKLHAAGVDPVTASRMMGHSSYKVTADVYTDIEAASQHAAAQKLNATFAKDLHKHA